MDWFVHLIIFFIVVSLIERLLKGGRRSRTHSEPGEAAGAEMADRTGTATEERDPEVWIEEEVGYELERRPRVILRRSPVEALPHVARAPGRSRPVTPTPRVQAPPRREERPVISLEEVGMRERLPPAAPGVDRAPGSPARPRVRAIPPVGARAAMRGDLRSREVSARRRRGDLPELASLGPLQRKIVWSEILTAPRALEPWSR